MNCLVAKSCPTLCNTMKHSRLPCPSLSPWVCSNSCPLSQRWHPTISFSVTPFSSCPQSFPAPGAHAMSQLLISGGQSIGASASVHPMNIQGWFPLRLTGLISLQPKGLSRVFSSTIRKHQFFSAHPCLWSTSLIHTWLLEKPQLCYPFIYWWTSRLLPCPGYWKQCCNEHWGIHVSLKSGFFSVYAQHKPLQYCKVISLQLK